MTATVTYAAMAKSALPLTTRSAERGAVIGSATASAARAGDITRRHSHHVTTASETGHATGTRDKVYDILWYTEACLDNVLRLETYIQDAERDGDSELADFFRKAQADSRKGAEQGKQHLRSRL